MSLLNPLLTLFTLWTVYVIACDDCNDSSADSTSESIEYISYSTEESDSDDSCDDVDADWLVQYQEKSTQFKIYNPCDDEEEFLSLEMSDLTEYDLNALQTQNKVTFPSVSADQHNHDEWEWDTDSGSIALYESYKVLKNTFIAADIINNASFILTTYLFRQDAIIHNNSTYITKNSLKWNVNITNWPLLNDSDYLELCITLITNRANANESDSESESDDSTDSNDDDDDDDDVHYWRAGDFDVGVFDTAECGQNGIINVNVTQGIIGRNEKKFCFAFDPCADNIFYDPIISHMPSHLPNDGQLITVLSRILLIVVAGAIACIIIIVSICYIYKKKKHGPYQGLLETQLT